MFAVQSEKIIKKDRIQVAAASGTKSVSKVEENEKPPPPFQKPVKEQEKPPSPGRLDVDEAAKVARIIPDTKIGKEDRDVVQAGNVNYQHFKVKSKI